MSLPEPGSIFSLLTKEVNFTQVILLRRRRVRHRCLHSSVAPVAASSGFEADDDFVPYEDVDELGHCGGEDWSGACTGS